jgi:CheY-like chemotaxis protein
MGATFIVDLPLRAVRARSDQDSDRTPSGIGVGLPVALDGLRILMVDDDADARELVTVILEQAGAEVVAAASAAEALAVLTDKRNSMPDCIVSDISMPDKNGYWLIGKIRSLARDDGGHLPAIALTAFGRASDRIAALTAGFQRHVSKPVEPTELVMVIAGLTNRGGVVANECGEN